MSIDAAQLRQISTQVNQLFAAMRHKRKSLELAAQKAADRPNDERLERDRASKSRALRGVTEEYNELKERLVKSWC